MKLLACIDEDKVTAGSVLATATSLARALRMDVEALHVRDTPATVTEELAREAGVRIRVEHGDPIAAITRAFDEPDVEMAVLGLRRPGGPEPAGRTAFRLMAATPKPVVAVPPGARGCTGGGLTRLLLPLNGSPDAMVAIATVGSVFERAHLEVVFLHVFDAAHTPAFFDRPEHDIDVWSHEFVARQTDDERTRLELRTGQPGVRVLDVADDEQVDMIVLAWSQDVSPGHAEIVKEVLRGASVPVMLVSVVEARADVGAKVAARAR